MKPEELTKSIDALIDEVFSDLPAAEPVEKSKSVMDELVGSPKQTKAGEEAGPAQTQADQVKVEKPKKQKENEDGRPSEVSDVPDVDEDGSRAKGYESIQKPNSATPETSPKGTVVKSFEVSEADFELLQKAKKAQEAEQLVKAREEQANLIKSSILEATQGLRDENAALKKSLEETQALVKSFAKKPQAPKAVTQVAALEKSFAAGEEIPQGRHFSKSEMLDVAESLVKSKELTIEQVIQLEDTGYIYEPAARAALEKALLRKK